MLRKATVAQCVQTSLSVLNDLIHILIGNLIAIECKSRPNLKTYFLPYLISGIMHQLKNITDRNMKRRFNPGAHGCSQQTGP